MMFSGVLAVPLKDGVFNEVVQGKWGCCLSHKLSLQNTFSCECYVLENTEKIILTNRNEKSLITVIFYKES